MDVPTKAIVDVLTYLLPGFVSAALVYVLTPVPRPIPFERVIQALIYTIIIQALVAVVRTPLLAIGTHCCVVGRWTEDVTLLWSVILAIVIGIAAAWANNTDIVHSMLRKAGITHQTSFPSEWYGAFCQNDGYIVLHLTGERRLYGWPEEWPSWPDQGHFVIVQGEWLTQEGRVELANVKRLVIRAKDVEMVEMMKTLSVNGETENGGSQSTDTAATYTDPAGPSIQIAADGAASATQAPSAASTASEALASAS